MLQLEAYDSSRHLRRQPAWWLLYLIGFLLVGGMGVLERFLPDGLVRTVLECAAVFLAFGMMLVWRHYNRVRWA